MARRGDRRRLALVLGPATLFLGTCFIGPLAVMFIFSFLKPGLYGGVEWSFYQLVICYPAALWVSGLSARWRTLLVFLTTLPFFVSLVVRLFIWVLILRPTGFLNSSLIGLGLISEPIDIIFTETAVLIGMAYVLLPFMFLPVYASVEKLDRSLIEASSDLGGSPLKTFFRVTLPLTLPGIAAGAVLVFIPSLGNFIVPDLLGGAKVLMIGNLIEQQFLSARNWPFGAALSVMIMVVMFVLITFYLRQIGRQGANE
jgi:spermidine/putrescine transport system permease protein